MFVERRSGIDRRSGKDRRTEYNVDYFLNGGIERRTWQERRTQPERRAGWERITDSSSILVNGFGYNGEELVVDRRRHKRYLANDGAYTLFGRDTAKVGQIIDVSIGGMAFCYVGKDEQQDGLFKLDIFLSDNSFYLERLAAKMTSEVKIDPPSGSASAPMQRRGVQFCDLTKTQEAELRYFLQHYTTEEV